MRILLDENLNWRLRRDLPGHQVESVPLIGWAGTKNGELLRKAAEDGFEVLVTMDGNLAHQQDISRLRPAIVALRAPTNLLEPAKPLMAPLLIALPDLKPGTLTFLGIGNRT